MFLLLSGFKELIQKEYQELKNEEKDQDLPSYQANNITGVQDPIEDKYQDINQALEEVALSVSNDSRAFSELIKEN